LSRRIHYVPASVIGLNCIHTDAVVTQWIQENFRNLNRPKCLALIGPTETGTSSEKKKNMISSYYYHTLLLTIQFRQNTFALSLPSQLCYFKGRYSLNTWCDEARYLVFDDISWEDFEKRNFPSKKDLLSANAPVAVR
jgi:hypothetical protein